MDKQDKEMIEKAKIRYDELRTSIVKHIIYTILSAVGMLGFGYLHDILRNYHVGDTMLHYGTPCMLLAFIFAITFLMNVSYFLELFISKVTSEGNYDKLPFVNVQGKTRLRLLLVFVICLVLLECFLIWKL